MSDSFVIVKYQTETSYCSCCDQKLPVPKTSKVKEYRFDKERAMRWVDWNEVVEYPEDVEKMVPEFVYETIGFYAADSFAKVIIEPSEIEKVKELILREFSPKTDEGVTL